MHEDQSRINNLWEKIFERRPILGALMRAHGDRNLFAYTQDFPAINPIPLLDARREELISAVHGLLVPRLGDETAAAVAAQLRASPLVSTTDHHGPLYHPFWLNANIISSLPFTVPPQKGPQYLVVFSFSSISLNNASGWPRGIEFHGGERGEGPLIKLPLFPDKNKMAVVYRMRGIQHEDIQRSLRTLQKFEHAGALSRTHRQKLEVLLNEFFTGPQMGSFPDFTSQVTALNTRLWPKMFHPARTEKDTQKHDAPQPPTLVYLEIETLVTELLLRYHLHTTESPLHQMIFNPKWHISALRHFNNITGAFSRTKRWGTHFFWGVNAHLHRAHLDIDTDALIIRETGERILLTPDNIATALREKKIFPSMLLCYLAVALHYGMKCLGGFSQVHDLTMVKEGWSKVLLEFSMHEEAHAVHAVPTEAFGGDGLVLSYLHSQGALIPATGIDMLLTDKDTQYERYSRLAHEVTLREMMAPMLPEIYTVLYHAHEREKQFEALTAAQVMDTTGLKKKLSSLLNT